MTSGIELSPEQAQALEALRPVASTEALRASVEQVEALSADYVVEVMEPDQDLDDTFVALRDLYLLLLEHGAALAPFYDEVWRGRLRAAIVGAVSLNALLQDNLRLGGFKARTVEEVITASLPWRENLRRKVAFAFFFQPGRLAAYEDHNASGTVDEEVADLRALLTLTRRDAEALAAVGFDEAARAEGERLLAEAEGRDVSALLGMRSRRALKRLRDRALTLAVTLGRHALSAARSVLYGDERAHTFSQVKLGGALRRPRPQAAKAEATRPLAPETLALDALAPDPLAPGADPDRL